MSLNAEVVNIAKEWVVLEVEGQKVFGILHLPVTASPVPAVAMCHGFGGNKVGNHRMLVRAAEGLAKKGIAALRIDFRGCGDSDGEFADTSLEGQIHDLLAAYQFLENHVAIDPDRIGVCGSSLGSVVAIKTATKYQKFRSLAVWVPVFDSSQWRLNTGESTAKGPLMINGHLVGKKMIPDLLSLSVAEELPFLSNKPLLHIHSDQDGLLDPMHREQFVAVRGEAEAKDKAIRLPLGDHKFSRPEDQDVVLDLTVNWFQKTL